MPSSNCRTRSRKLSAHISTSLDDDAGQFAARSRRLGDRTDQECGLLVEGAWSGSISGRFSFKAWQGLHGGEWRPKSARTIFCLGMLLKQFFLATRSSPAKQITESSQRSSAKQYFSTKKPKTGSAIAWHGRIWHSREARYCDTYSYPYSYLPRCLTSTRHRTVDSRKHSPKDSRDSIRITRYHITW